MHIPYSSKGTKSAPLGRISVSVDADQANLAAFFGNGKAKFRGGMSIRRAAFHPVFMRVRGRYACGMPKAAGLTTDPYQSLLAASVSFNRQPQQRS